MISVAICDDNAAFCAQLSDWLREYGREKKNDFSIEEFSGGSELLAAMEERGFDLTFLDIEMPGMDGIQAGLAIRQREAQTLIVYISGYERYLRQLFEVEPFRFLAKPLQKEELYHVLDRAMERLEHGRLGLFRFQVGRSAISLRCRDILYLESSIRKVIVHSKKGDYTYYGKLDDAQKHMEEASSRFLRIHKAYLINIDEVEAFQADKAALRDGTILSISEANRAAVRSRLWEEMGGRP